MSLSDGCGCTVTEGDGDVSVKVRSLSEAEVHIASLNVRVCELERMVSDMSQRFDTLQTPLWKRILFRLDGWPGQRDLNADHPAWRPWRKWWVS